MIQKQDSKLSEPLIIYDATRQRDGAIIGGDGPADFLLCLNEDSKVTLP